LPMLVASILGLRALGCAAYARSCRRHCGWRWKPAWPRRETACELLALGGWIGVSNLVGPLLTTMDRLLIGALVPLGKVGLYAAPCDLLSRLMVIPYALVATVFPSVASVTHGAPARQALSVISRWLHLGMFPLLFLTMTLAQPAMALWLGEDAGLDAAAVMQILVPGIYLNTLAQGPATLIQAAGRPRDMALLHLMELPIFLGLLWMLTARWGIVGMAAAATIRFAFDALAVTWLAQRGLRLGAWAWPAVLECAGVVVALLAAGLACRDWEVSLMVAALGLPLLLWHGWARVLSAGERASLRAVLLRARAG
jgi:O-antigen/teichoic acid export membrane protein